MTHEATRERLRRELLERRLAGSRGNTVGLPRADRTGVLPLSAGQRRLWFLDRLDPGSVEYVVPLVSRLPEPFDPAALERALTELVSRHEVLRTRFPDRAGEPYQEIDPPRPVRIPVVAVERLAEAVSAEVWQGFDLAGAPPWRAVVLWDGHEHVLVWTLHHIACDGWSLGILSRELTTLLAGGQLPPAPRIQYADYAAWQPAAARDLDYWRAQLAGLEPVELPTDRARPARRDPAGAMAIFEVPAELAGAVTEIGRARGATPYMTMLAVFCLLLARHSGQRDLAVGSPVAGRNRPELDGVVGFFVNMLVMRADLRGDPTFSEYLDRVRESALAAFAHQELPFERLVDDLAPERDLSRHALFQQVFTYEEATEEGEAPAVASVTAKFDLQLTLSRQPDGTLIGVVEYATALFDAATINTFTDRFIRLLHSVAARPDAQLGDLPILDAQTRAQLLTWSGIPVDDPIGDDVVRRFEHQVRLAPDSTAVVAGAERLSYADLNSRANAMAKRLRARGVRPETRVGVCLERGADLVVALLAVAKSGGAYVPLDPAYPPARLQFIVADAAVHLVVTDEAHAPLVTGPRLLTDRTVLADDPAPVGELDRLAYVIYTSGSTGQPKGVLVTHANLARLFTAEQDRFGFCPDDVWTMSHSFAFDFSVWEMWGALVHGGTLVVVSAEVARDPEQFAALRVAEGVTVLSQTPSAFAHLLRVDRPRIVVFGGEQLTTPQPWPGVELVNMYGITETTVHVTHRTVTDRSPIGRPLSDLHVYVLDSFGDVAPPGVTGEMFVGGRGVARGYLGRPRLTADRFVPNTFTPGGRLYRTGDLGRWTAEGELEFRGRNDQQVKIRGYRIEPGEIRSALMGHAAVEDAAVLARDGRLVAYVVTAGTLSAAGVREHLRGLLPPYMVPGVVVVLDALPLTPSGKLDTAALSDGPQRVSPAVPATADQRRMAEVWQGVLRRDQVNADEDFFELGGDSLRAVALVGALRAEGFDVAVRDVFEQRTVAALTAHATGRDAPEPYVPVAPFSLLRPADLAALPEGVTDAYPLSRVQAGMVYEMLADPEVRNYHNVTSFSIRDDRSFSLDALRAAAAVVVARHEVLRTSIDLTTYSEPLQLVHAGAELTVEQAAFDEEFLARERATLFDLAVPPLLRIFVDPGVGAWRLSMTECHAILEGWSYHALLMELLGCYRAIRDGQAVPEPEPAGVRYADFVAAELETVADPAARAYWSGVVEEYAPLTLPTVWAGSGREPYQIQIPLFDVHEGLVRLAGAARTPLKSVMLAAHLKVLSQVTHEDGFHTGLVCDTRPEVAGADRVYGMFINTVPFAYRPAASSWRTLVREVFDAEVAMWPYRRFPLPAIHRGRVEVYFNYLDFTVVDTELVDLPDSVDISPNEFPLSVTVLGGLLTLTSRPDVLRREEAERLAAMYTAVLESMAADPDGDALATYVPRREQLTETLARPEASTLEVVEETARLLPDAVAVTCWDGRALTYAQLDEEANQVAWLLRELGAGPESVVGVCLDRGPALLPVLLGIWKAGAAYTPLEPTHPAERWGAVLADSGVQVVITGYAQATRKVFDGTIIRSGEWRDRPTTRPPVETDLDGLAYVIYTSGSTGRPKGVLIGHRGLANYLWWCVEGYAAHGLGGAPLFSSIAFDMVIPNLFTPLMIGQRVHLLPPALEPGDLGALLVAGAPYNFIKLTPGHLELLTHQLESGEGLAELLAIGADAFPTGILNRWAALAGPMRLLNEYGPTEISVANSTFAINGPVEGDLVPIGRPIPNTTMYVLDRWLEPVPSGVIGEIYIGGAGVARGYRGRAGLTAERFVPDPFGPPGSRLYRTGDLGRERDSGDVDFLGRTDDQIKIRAYRIEPGEIQAVLNAHPLVHESLVLARGDTLLAYWVPTAKEAEPDLSAWCRERLPDYLIPALFIGIAAIPLNANGKVDRKALPEPGEARRRARVEPRDETERRIAAIWTDMLGVEPGVTDDFFALGGHSILVVRLISRLRDAFSVTLPMRVVFDHPTIEAITRLIETQTTPVRPIPPVDRGGALPLSAAQGRLWLLNRLNPDSPEYLVPIAVRLPAPVDADSVQAAWTKIVARHEILRTRYVLTGGEPVQVIDEPGPIDFAALELSHDDALRWAADTAATPFALDRDWPIRVRLAHLPGGDALLTVVLHHIACDGWSTTLLAREFADPPADPPAVQYADYAAWQQSSSDSLSDSLDYWRRRLAGLARLPLAVDRPRPRVRDWAGGTVDFVVPEQTAGKLREIAARAGTTLFTTVLTAFQVLLARQTGARDIPIGTPVAGREHPDLADLVGCTVNTLVIRGDLRGDPTFAELLAATRQTVLEALNHQHVPFETLVEELAHDRDLSRNPLFDVLFALDHDPWTWPVQPVPLDRGVAKFDLNLQLTDGDALTGLFEYGTALFDPPTIDRLTARFLRLLDAITPDSRLSDLAALEPLDNPLPAPAPSGVSVAEAVAEFARRTPDAVAVTGGFTYDGLDRRARLIAGGLRARGVGQDSVVAVCLDREPDLLAVLLGIWYAGGAYLPLEPSWPAARRASLLADAAVDLVITRDLLTTLLADAADLGGTRAPLGAAERVESTGQVIPDPDALAYVIYTSGSTGQPKGVEISHGSLTAPRRRSSQ